MPDASSIDWGVASKVQVPDAIGTMNKLAQMQIYNLDAAEKARNYNALRDLGEAAATQGVDSDVFKQFQAKNPQAAQTFANIGNIGAETAAKKLQMSKDFTSGMAQMLSQIPDRQTQIELSKKGLAHAVSQGWMTQAEADYNSGVRDANPERFLDSFIYKNLKPSEVPEVQGRAQMAGVPAAGAKARIDRSMQPPVTVPMVDPANPDGPPIHRQYPGQNLPGAWQPQGIGTPPPLFGGSSGPSSQSNYAPGAVKIQPIGVGIPQPSTFIGQSPRSSGWGKHAEPVMAAFKEGGASDAFIQGAMANGLGEGGFAEPWQKPWSEKENSFGHWQLNQNGELPGYLASEGRKNPQDSASQAKYLMRRMEEEVPGITKTDDPKAATDAIATKFERYKGNAPGQRYGLLANAQRLMRTAGAAPSAEDTGATVAPATGASNGSTFDRGRLIMDPSVPNTPAGRAAASPMSQLSADFAAARAKGFQGDIKQFEQHQKEFASEPSPPASAPVMPPFDSPAGKTYREGSAPGPQDTVVGPQGQATTPPGVQLVAAGASPDALIPSPGQAPTAGTQPAQMAQAGIIDQGGQFPGSYAAPSPARMKTLDSIHEITLGEHKELQKQATGVKTGLAALDKLDSILDQGYVTGTLADKKQKVNTAIATFADSIGKNSPMADKESALGALFSTISSELGFAMVTQLGSREAMQVVQQVMLIKPNILHSRAANRAVIESLRQGFKLAEDRRKFYEGWVDDPKKYGRTGIDTEFDRTHPTEIYASRVVPIPVTSKTAQEHLIPGAIYNTSKIPNKSSDYGKWDGDSFEPIPAPKFIHDDAK